jgi:DNA-binding winged helix-turn-helix (wHTH) protein
MEIASAVIRFDNFVVNAKSRVVSRNGETISLTPKVFDTLLALLSRPGQTMTKEELMTAVWGDSVVEESNLTQNVAVLRRALGDNGKKRRFILTVSGRGYRFVQDVERSDLSERVPPYKMATAGVATDLQPFRAWANADWIVRGLIAATAFGAAVLAYLLWVNWR